MAQEYKVIIDRDISDEVKKEIEIAIRGAVLEKIAQLDFAGEMSVSRLAGGIGHGGTAGMMIK
jgi:hypothetical protein